MSQAWNFSFKTETPKYKWKKFSNFAYNKLIDLCKMKQCEVKDYLYRTLMDYDYIPMSFDGGIVAKGDLPILLTAHMDTVHKEKVKEVRYRMDGNDVVINSPQGIGGDDRCGIYIILKLLELGHKPSIIFCEDEEIGCVGANKATNNPAVMDMLKGNRYIVELDRRGKEDAVYYDCENEEFEDYITEHTGRVTNFGSCSDISYLAPALKIAAVNFSVGYYHEHHIEEEINLAQLEKTIQMMDGLLKHEAECEPYDYFIYIEHVYNFNSKHSWFDDDDDDWTPTKLCQIGKEKIFEFIFIEYEEENIDSIEADSYIEAVGMLLTDHPSVCYNDILDWYCTQ